MYFPPSEVIATELPTLRTAIEQIDNLIYQTGAVPLRLSVTADFLGVQTPLAKRLLAQFVEHGVLRANQACYCPTCDQFLEEQSGDDFVCDICEATVSTAEAHREVAYFVVDPIVRSAVEPVGNPSSVATPLVIQFIAGDRGGPQMSQVQAPREHREMNESLQASRYPQSFQIGAADLRRNGERDCTGAHPAPRNPSLRRARRRTRVGP